MRTLPTLLLLLSVSAFAHGQDQEKKLVDRLLRPDMALENSAQNKTFTAATAAQDRSGRRGDIRRGEQARVSKFYWEEKNRSKPYSNTGEFGSQPFKSREFYTGKESSNLTGRPIHNSDLAFETQTATGIRNVATADKKTDAGAFAGNRQFLDHGKSQKALSQQNRPMTIEEVRELLNKNK